MLLFENFAQAVGYLAAISLAFAPLEHFWAPPSRQSRPVGQWLAADRAETMGNVPWLRREWLNDLTFYMGQALIFNATTIFVLGLLFNYIAQFQFGPAAFKSLPLWAKIPCVVVLCDLFIYWGHRAQHKFSLLWRFHRVHHTATHVDYLAAYREHPLDNKPPNTPNTLPAVLLGLDLNTIAGFVTFRGLWALFIHSNVTIRLGFLEVLLGSPHLHHWHHELKGRGLCNYANLSPLMDIIFGTYYSPAARPGSYGTSDAVKQGWFWQMVEPFYRK